MADNIHVQLMNIANDVGVRCRPISFCNAYSNSPYEYECTFKVQPYRVKWYRSKQIFLIRVDGSDSPISFVYGIRDPAGIFTKRIVVRRLDKTLRILYDPEDPDSTMLRQWLNAMKNIYALLSLNIGVDDILSVGSGQASMYIHPRGNAGNKEILDKLISLVQLFPSASTPEAEYIRTARGQYFKPEKLPISLRCLAPLIAEWSIGDDVDRSRKVEDSSIKKLKHFMDSVSPLFNIISKYVETNANDEASVLQWILEAIHEVELTLGKKLRR